MGIFISNGLKEYTEHSGDFLFINSPRCWVAVRAVNSQFNLANQILLKNQKGKGTFYKLENDQNPVIIEASDPGDYVSFDAFKTAALKCKLVTRNGGHSYHSLSGDQFTMFDDLSLPKINGVHVAYNPTMAYNSRYIKSEWDSGVVKITVGGTETTLDFMAASISTD